MSHWGDPRRVNVVFWHVHGSWATAFVQGGHRYLLPTLPQRGPWGEGRPAAWEWPPPAVQVSPRELADADVDVLQRPEGFCSTDPDRLAHAVRERGADLGLARELGTAARAHVLGRHGLGRFLAAWADVLGRAVDGLGPACPAGGVPTGRS